MRLLLFTLAFIALAAVTTAGPLEKRKTKCAETAPVDDGVLSTRTELDHWQIADIRKAMKNLEPLNRPHRTRELNSVTANMKAKQQIDYILKHKEMAIQQGVVRVFLDETMKYNHLVELNEFCAENNIWWCPVSLGIDQFWMQYLQSLSRWKPRLDDKSRRFHDAGRKFSLESGVGPADFE